MPVASLPEQAAKVWFLDGTAANIEKTVSRSRRQIDLLHEYRTRLIADVVTGKLDVRETATALPKASALPETDSAAVENDYANQREASR